DTRIPVGALGRTQTPTPSDVDQYVAASSLTRDTLIHAAGRVRSTTITTRLALAAGHPRKFYRSRDDEVIFEVSGRCYGVSSTGGVPGSVSDRALSPGRDRVLRDGCGDRWVVGEPRHLDQDRRCE